MKVISWNLKFFPLNRGTFDINVREMVSGIRNSKLSSGLELHNSVVVSSKVENLIKLLSTEKADVIFLQEVTSYSHVLYAIAEANRRIGTTHYKYSTISEEGTQNLVIVLANTFEQPSEVIVPNIEQYLGTFTKDYTQISPEIETIIEASKNEDYIKTRPVYQTFFDPSKEGRTSMSTVVREYQAYERIIENTFRIKAPLIVRAKYKSNDNIYIINNHLKSNVLSWSKIGFTSTDSDDDYIEKMFKEENREQSVIEMPSLYEVVLADYNKTIREIQARVVSSFIEQKRKEHYSNFIVAGDLNTTTASSDIAYIGDTSISIIKNGFQNSLEGNTLNVYESVIAGTYIKADGSVSEELDHIYSNKEMRSSKTLDDYNSIDILDFDFTKQYPAGTLVRHTTTLASGKEFANVYESIKDYKVSKVNVGSLGVNGKSVVIRDIGNRTSGDLIKIESYPRVLYSPETHKMKINNEVIDAYYIWFSSPVSDTPLPTSINVEKTYETPTNYITHQQELYGEGGAEKFKNNFLNETGDWKAIYKRWRPEKVYYANTLVIDNNKVYFCTISHMSEKKQSLIETYQWNKYWRLVNNGLNKYYLSDHLPIYSELMFE